MKVLRKTLRKQELFPQLLRDPLALTVTPAEADTRIIMRLCVCLLWSCLLWKYFAFLTNSGRFVECLWVTRNWLKIHKIAAMGQRLQKVFENPVSLDTLPLIFLALLYAFPYFLHWCYLNSGGRKGNQKEQENCFNKVHICVPVCFVVVLKYLYSSIISRPEKVSKSPWGDIFCFLFKLNVHRLSFDV